jgi:hypothetical protein
MEAQPLEGGGGAAVAVAAAAAGTAARKSRANALKHPPELSGDSACARAWCAPMHSLVWCVCAPTHSLVPSATDSGSSVASSRICVAMIINRMTGEPILPARTANQRLTNFTGANREPISGQILAPVKLVHRSCDLSGEKCRLGPR